MYTMDSRVRYSEIDENESLSLFGMINYFQDCSTFQSEDFGKGIAYLEEMQKAWWLIHWQIEILRLPRLGEHIRISTWAYGFKSMYGYRNFSIRSESGELLAKADSRWLYMDLVKMLPAKPESEALDLYLGEGDTKMEVAEADIGEYEAEAVHTAKLVVEKALLDTYHHVNNAWYVKIAEGALPSEVDIRGFSVQYKKGAVLGDILVIKAYTAERGFLVRMTDTQDKLFAVVSFCTK